MLQQTSHAAADHDEALRQQMIARRNAVAHNFIMSHERRRKQEAFQRALQALTIKSSASC